MIISSPDLLIIGPKSQRKTGGVLVLFEYFVQDLAELGIKYRFRNSSADIYPHKLFKFLAVAFDIANPFGPRTIFLHGTAADFKFFSPFLIASKYFFGKKYFLRKFAGNFDEVFDGYSPFTKNLSSFLLKASNGNFFETTHLVDFFATYNCRTFLFPNVRRRATVQSVRYTGGVLRLILLAQLYYSKGVNDAIEVVKQLEGVELDIYGPLIDFELSDFEGLPAQISYKGTVLPHDVQTTMSNYHGLILPTYYAGEGYPGVIIEAFSVGLPVIASRWRAIPELLSSDQAMFEPRDLEDIKRAIFFLKGNSCFLKDVSVEGFREFDSLSNTRLSLERCGII